MAKATLGVSHIALEGHLQIVENVSVQVVGTVDERLSGNLTPGYLMQEMFFFSENLNYGNFLLKFIVFSANLEFFFKS